MAGQSDRDVVSHVIGTGVGGSSSHENANESSLPPPPPPAPFKPTRVRAGGKCCSGKEINIGVGRSSFV